MFFARRVLLLAAALMLSACGKEPLYQEQGYVFGTLVEVSVYGEDEATAKQAVAAVMQEFQRLHNLLHAWKPSALSELNTAFAKGKIVAVTPELEAMLRDAAQLAEQSGGLFNPAIGGLVKLWGFHADEFKPALPDEKQLAALVAAQPQMKDIFFNPDNLLEPNPLQLPLVRASAVRIACLTHFRGRANLAPPLSRGGWEGFEPSGQSGFNPSSVRGAGERTAGSRNRAVQLDLGGYAKGYALDRAAELLKKMGVHNVLVNIGGNVLALGTHGSRAWRVGIQHPRKPGPLATLELHDGEAIGTSGDYQRYFELDGKRYCHLIDPRTGQPAQGVQAVTVLTRGARAGVLSDATSKPLFIAGAGAWLAAAQKMQLNEALLIDAAGTVHLTAAMQKRLEFTDKSIISKIAE